MTFLEELREQRWDDHRFYHQSRVNQSLHLFSALCFVCAYALVAFEPLVAAVLGWVVAMVSRQVGHFWFEPRGYDSINHTTFEHKEAIKVGFNLQRKVVLLSVWLALPAVLWFATPDWPSYLQRVGQAWLLLAGVGLLARTLWLCVTRNVQTGVVWLTKILTDPFHDVMLYHRAPLQLLRGEWFDPMLHARHRR